MRQLCFVLFVLTACSDSKRPDTSETQQTIDSLASPWFEEVALQVGVDHTYYSSDNGNYNIIETMGGGAALLDFDNDGDLDLYVTQGNVLDGDLREDLVNRLYENVGDGNFVDRTSKSEAGDSRYSIGVTTGDYDNDGFVDLYITNFGRNTLLRNQGDGTFMDVTEQASVGDLAFSASAEFADLNGDGFLDLFVTNYLDWTPATEKPCFSEQNLRDYCNPSSYDAPISDTLYFNNGDGTFTNVTMSSGIGSAVGTGLGVAIAPFNDDALLDIFVANDGMEDRLWINQGDGTFIDQARILGVAVDDTGKEKASMGVVVHDIDRDGDLDILVTTLFGETDSLFLNQDGVFVDATARLGLAADTRTYTRWGVVLEDFNDDGSDELYEATGRVRWQADNWDDDWLAEPNLFFTQNSQGRFSKVVPSGGVATPLIASAHGLAAGDIDNDGDVDIVVVNKDAQVHVLRNVAPKKGNWIILDIRNAHGAPALGASVEIRLEDGTTRIKYIRAASGYASASDPRVHIGLGDASQVESVNITWPNGTNKTLGPLQAGKAHVLTP